MHELGGSVMRESRKLVYLRRLRPWSQRVGLATALAGGLLALAGCVGVAEPGTVAAPGYGYRCSAGVYVCQLPEQVALGSQCSCPGLGAPSYGSVR